MHLGATKFAITDRKLYVPVVTLSTQDNAKLLQQLKSGFKRTVNWDKYQSKATTQMQNPYLSYLIDHLNRLFVLLFENIDDTTSRRGHLLPKVEIKDYSVMFDRQNSRSAS